MILDNLTRALKKQNWIAVAIEFVIVIAGVVIGFQISQFAQDRSEREYALKTLAHVEVAIREIALVREVTLAGLNEHVEAFTSASLIIMGRAESEVLTQEQCDAVATSGRITIAPDSLPAMEGLLDTDVLSAIGNEKLRLEIIHFTSKQEAVREWAHLKHSELYDLVDLYPEQVRFVFSDTPDENGHWAQRAHCNLEAMRDSRGFMALMMSNLEMDRNTQSFVYGFMNEAFEELHITIKAEMGTTH